MDNTIQILMDDYIELLENRYNQVQQWHSTAAQELWENFLNLIRECPPTPEQSHPWNIVDNYLINGEFVSKENWEGDYYHKKYQTWDNLCEDAIVYNDEYALMQM